jgi:cell division protein ZipA
MRTWLIIIGGLVALGILLDSIRRMRSAGRDSLNMDLQMQGGLREEDPLEELRRELPNGGARKVDGAVTNPPRSAKSAAYLAKTSLAKDDARKATPKMDSKPVSKQEPTFATTPSLEDTQKTRRTPTMSATPAASQRHPVDLEQQVPMLMDADDRSEATFNDDRDPLMSGGAPVLSKPRVVPRKLPTDLSSADEEREVIVINVMSRQPEGFVGANLLENVLACGMRYGDMNIFHHYAPSPDDDSVLYSMANIIKPGTFDLNNMQSFQTPGVSFFMALPLKASSAISAMDAFDKMYHSAKRISQSLNGELKDERRSVMTGQTIEHCRQRISEFSRKKLSRSGKFTADH